MTETQTRFFVTEIDSKFAIVRESTFSNGAVSCKVIAPEAFWFSTREAAQKEATDLTAFVATSNEAVDIYSNCPACSGRRYSVQGEDDADVIFGCRSCSAQFGHVADLELYVAFLPPPSCGLGTGEADSYFDYTTSKSRTHGWIDSRGTAVQIG